MRRILTAQRDGKSVIVGDGEPPLTRAFDATPGFMSSIIWATEADTAVPLSGDDPTLHFSRMVPTPGATRVMKVTLPPDAVMMDPSWDPVAAAAENAAHLYGLADHFEADAPGMHQTDTVDYVIVMAGDVALEVDDGRSVQLSAGDVAVQGGVRHAWRNPGDTPVELIFVLIGARVCVSE